MKKIQLEFRSIQIVPVEKLPPGAEYTVTVMEMDENSIEKHILHLSLQEIFRNSTLLINFFLSIMITAVYTGIVYGVFTFLIKDNISDPLTFPQIIFITASSFILFAALGIFFSLRGGIAEKKNDLVLSQRGKGVWKIIDEKKFDDFYRLLMISKKVKK